MWMEARGMKFVTGANEQEHLTDNQIHTQCKMYVAALRIADDFGCHTIGIQYQQGLKDVLPASDLVEGMLNNSQPTAGHQPGRQARAGRRATCCRTLTKWTSVLAWTA